jgi:DNA-binding CsgD family transcriptional regulator/predicted ester cyclase
MKEINNHQIQVVRRLFNGTLDINNIALYEEFFTEDCCVHAFNNHYDLKFAKNFDAALAKGFDLKKLEINDIFFRQDKVYVYWTFTILHVGEYEGIPATFKELMVKGMSIYKFRNDLIDEIWQFWDRLGLLEQIGEVHVKIRSEDFESHYELLKQLGLEKYVERASKLSKRERQCLHLLLQGKTIKEVAAVLLLSPRTVEYYFNNVKDKLDCWNKGELFSAAQILDRLELL